jgi:endonuclease/exonuclease/phosphatase family metal-dependent hydrolase
MVTGVPPAVASTVRVSTYNLYLGADLAPLFSNALNPADVGPAVARVFQAVQATDPPARVDEVAALLAVASPDVVALQEVALWRTQTPADGSATPAADVAYDFLQLLVDALARRGLSYTPIIVATRADVEATGAFTPASMDVRFTDRDVLLVNSAAGLPIVSTDQGTFTAKVAIPTTAVGVITIPRGWIAAETRLGDQSLRIVAVHLESIAPPIRDAQAVELLAGPAVGSSLVLAGDFNFGPDALAYRGLTEAGLTDQWTQAAATDPGATCCQAPDLRNPVSQLTDRIDLIFTRGPLAATAAERLGEDPGDRTPSGLWPSDHAGVNMQLARTQ